MRHISYFRILRHQEGHNSAARACQRKFSLSICASNVSLPWASSVAWAYKRRLSDSLLRVAQGSKNRARVRNSCFVQGTSAPTKWIAHGVCCPQRVLRSCVEVYGVCVLLTMCWSRTDCTYIVLPIADMVCGCHLRDYLNWCIKHYGLSMDADPKFREF